MHTHQSCSAGLATRWRGHGAHGADGGGAGAALQSWRGGGGRRRLPHGGLRLGWGRGGKADTGHLVHWCEQTVLGLTLEIPDDTQIDVLIIRRSCIGCKCKNRPQYLVPATAPSFFPKGSSSSTPHHSPLAKSVSPKKRTTPAFVPATCNRNEDFTCILTVGHAKFWKLPLFIEGSFCQINQISKTPQLKFLRKDRHV